MADNRVQVAIVEDDDSVRRALGRLLAAANIAATPFGSGRAFLDSLSAARPDCVVLDLHMPEMNGLDVLAALRRAGLGLPVVVVTGRFSPESRAECLAAGARAYLGKPLDETVLLRTIGEAVGHGRRSAAVPMNGMA